MGLLTGELVALAPKFAGSGGGGGTEGGSGACGLRGAIPDALLPACGTCGAIGAMGADGLWSRAGIFGWAIRSLVRGSGPCTGSESSLVGGSGVRMPFHSGEIWGSRPNHPQWWAFGPR
ncbi:MAG: hypothetical protein J0I07_32875 [Myxococcales bacterium]|nr:hypothetical protein [Myxococcales bacterium]